MIRTSSGKVLTIWSSITGLKLTAEQESGFVSHRVIEDLMSHESGRLKRVGRKLYQQHGKLELFAWAEALDDDAHHLPRGPVKSPNARLDREWARDERFAGGRRKQGRKKGDLG